MTFLNTLVLIATGIQVVCAVISGISHRNQSRQRYEDWARVTALGTLVAFAAYCALRTSYEWTFTAHATIVLYGAINLGLLLIWLRAAVLAGRRGQ